VKAFLRKLAAVEQDLCDQGQVFLLFGIFLRVRASLGKWTLVVAAPTLPDDQMAALRLVVKALNKRLKAADLLLLSHVVVLDAKDRRLRAVWALAKVEHGLVELRNEELLGQEIERAYLITSRRPPRKITGRATKVRKSTVSAGRDTKSRSAVVHSRA